MNASEGYVWYGITHNISQTEFYEHQFYENQFKSINLSIYKHSPP